MSPPEFAKHWARELGAPAASIVQLRGGINNRVYRCGEGNSAHVIKGYAPAAPGQRDRMQAEVAFINYAAQVAPQYVPRLIHADHTLRCILLEHLEGDGYPEGVAPERTDVEAAVDFFRRLNADRAAAKEHIRLDAAEGFLRLSEHLANARQRIVAMRSEHLPKETQVLAAGLLSQVEAAAERVSHRTEALIAKGAVSDAIEPDQRCVSPSDFGFHNAIRTASGVKFFDYEFAGWDDPAKAAADFVLQPRVPTGLLASPLGAALDDNKKKGSESRCEVLGPVLRLKWVCIMLSVLQPERMAALLSTHPGTHPGHLTEARLARAIAYMQEETPFGLH